jgi:hypothetical protein
MLDKIANFVKWSSGKVSIKVKERTVVDFDFRGDTLSVDIIDPTIIGITNQANNEMGLFEKLKIARNVAETLNSKGLSISVLRKGKKALSIGREATPTISSFITGSDDIQIDSVSQVAKLSRDITKADQNKE